MLPFWKADPAVWPEVVAMFSDCPWPRAVAVEDLRWWEDQQAMGRERMPSSRQLAARWRWGRKRTRLLLREVDPLGMQRGPAGAQQGPTGGPVGAQPDTVQPVESGEKGPPGAHRGPSRGPVGATRALVTEHRTQNTEHRDPPTPQGGQLVLLSPAEPEPEPFAVWRQLNDVYASLPGCKRLRSPSKGPGMALARIADVHGLEDGRDMLHWMAYATGCPKASSLAESGHRTIGTVGKVSHVEGYWPHVARWVARGRPGMPGRKVRREVDPDPHGLLEPIRGSKTAHLRGE